MTMKALQALLNASNGVRTSRGERMALEALGGERVDTITNMDTCKPNEGVSASNGVRIQSIGTFGLSLFAI